MLKIYKYRVFNLTTPTKLIRLAASTINNKKCSTWFKFLYSLVHKSIKQTYWACTDQKRKCRLQKFLSCSRSCQSFYEVLMGLEIWLKAINNGGDCFPLRYIIANAQMRIKLKQLQSNLYRSIVTSKRGASRFRCNFFRWSRPCNFHAFNNT